MSDLALVGRSSSHFTRVARIFAAETAVPYTLRPIFDLTVTDAGTFGGNPALKIPVLVDVLPDGSDGDALYGCENICRELVRRAEQSSHAPVRAVLRGDCTARVVANAEELTLHVMTSEVTLIMAKVAGNPDLAPTKVRTSIERSLTWLDANVDSALAALPASRTVSFLEVSLFCLVEHLPFREVLDVTPYARLGAFRATFAERPSARATPFHFDKPAG